MVGWIEAGLWGLFAGLALVLGAALGFYLDIPRRMIAWAAAFGSGVLIAVLAIELMLEALEIGGITATSWGFLTGGVAFTAANLWLASEGAKHRKRSGEHQPSEEDDEGSGLAIALGSLLDGVPESIVIGIGLVAGGAVSVPMVVAVFLSNVPEGLASAAGMRRAGRPASYVFGVWGSIAVASAIAAVIGYRFVGQLSPVTVAVTIAIAAGAVLAMLADTMIPEAFADAHEYTGLITVAGFLAAFILGAHAG